jgi:hypothetical protein
MCSSTIDHENGIVTVVTPGLELVPGQRFHVCGGVAAAVAGERELRKASMSFAFWAARLGLPGSSNAPVVPDPAPLAEAQGMGLVHPGLAAEPAGPDQLAA